MPSWTAWCRVDRLKEGCVSHGVLPAKRPNSPRREDISAIRGMRSDAISCLHTPLSPPSCEPHKHGAGACDLQTDPNTANDVTSPTPTGKLQEEPGEFHSVPESKQHTAHACEGFEVTSPEHPLKTDSPDMPARGRSCSLPARRPLSPIGKAVRSSPMLPRHIGPPDMSKVESRYLRGSEGDGRSRPVSPNREVAHERHYLWKLGKMHADVPDYKRSQARMYESSHCLGTHKDQHVVTLKQACSSCKLQRPTCSYSDGDFQAVHVCGPQLSGTLCIVVDPTA